MNRENGLRFPANRSAALVGTKRFCAACLVTPMAAPIWLQAGPTAGLVDEVADQRVGLLSSLAETANASDTFSSGPPSGCWAFT